MVGQYDEYLVLLKALFAALKETTDLLVDKRVEDAGLLFTKFAGHAASALYLLRDTWIPELTELGRSFRDAGSIHVLARAALESCVLFHYIYIDPQTQDERDFRYYAWRLNGLLNERKWLQLLSERDRGDAERRHFEKEKTRPRIIGMSSNPKPAI